MTHINSQQTDAEYELDLTAKNYKQQTGIF